MNKRNGIPVEWPRVKILHSGRGYASKREGLIIKKTYYVLKRVRGFDKAVKLRSADTTDKGVS